MSLENDHPDPTDPNIDTQVSSSDNTPFESATEAYKNDSKAWQDRVMRNMRRMAVDEEYRLEIAKWLS